MFRYFFIVILLFSLYACQSGEIQDASATSLDSDSTSIVEIAIDTTPLASIFHRDSFEWVDGFIDMDWKFLSRVIFEDGYINDTLAMIPIFHDDIKVLEGQPVQMSGYLIPFGETTGKLHFLSAYPNSQCFFCGGAGPESVMDVMTVKAHLNFKMDDIITFRGTLHLNDSDLDYMNYILKDAKRVVKD
ncbi:MAG: hypothetical protein ACI94Y_002791 [Maribacter sp.]|jgi:hypothetical protein